MNARYVSSLILMGLVLAGCTGCIDSSQDEGQESIPETPVGAATGADEFTEEEMDSFEDDLAEIEALLGGLNEIDAMGEINDSTFA